VSCRIAAAVERSKVVKVAAVPEFPPTVARLGKLVGPALASSEVCGLHHHSRRLTNMIKVVT
jgi:hypothetical protein